MSVLRRNKKHIAKHVGSRSRNALRRKVRRSKSNGGNRGERSINDGIARTMSSTAMNEEGN